MLARRPFSSLAALERDAEDVWARLAPEDYLEAFAHHPAIGADDAELRARAGDAASWSKQEQAGVAAADAKTRRALRAHNRAYRDRFGFVFLVCASGKSAAEMLTLLEERLKNDRLTEIGVAAAEQAKITRLRLERLGP
jgi:2-oxo-4-hydroxy-4-carboxy-5-ureidoimidazoline decarboxylase